MNIRDKVVSLDLAKRMKELGWDYGTEKYWVYSIAERTSYLIDRLVTSPRIICYPAPDAIEIEEKLPVNTKIDTMLHIIVTGRTSLGTHFCRLEWCGHTKIGEIGSTEAEARGKMWVYLKEKKYV